MKSMDEEFKKQLLSVVQNTEIGYGSNYHENLSKAVEGIPCVHLNFGKCEQWDTVEKQNDSIKEELKNDGPNCEQLKRMIFHLEQNYTQNKLLKSFEILRNTN